MLPCGVEAAGLPVAVAKRNAFYSKKQLIDWCFHVLLVSCTSISLFFSFFLKMLHLFIYFCCDLGSVEWPSLEHKNLPFLS